MKHCLLLIAMLFSSASFGQAIYDANGQYKGYSQTSPSGVTTTYNANGQSIGSSQVDNAQTNYYSPNGGISRHEYRNTHTAATKYNHQYTTPSASSAGDERLVIK